MADSAAANPSFRLIGQDFTPPDIRAKVTGTARYSEDIRMDELVWRFIGVAGVLIIMHLLSRLFSNPRNKSS